MLIFLLDSEMGRKAGHGDAVAAEYKGPSPADQVPPRSKTKYRSTKEADKSKVVYVDMWHEMFFLLPSM